MLCMPLGVPTLVKQSYQVCKIGTLVESLKAIPLQGRVSLFFCTCIEVSLGILVTVHFDCPIGKTMTKSHGSSELLLQAIDSCGNLLSRIHPKQEIYAICGKFKPTAMHSAFET